MACYLTNSIIFNYNKLLLHVINEKRLPYYRNHCYIANYHYTNDHSIYLLDNVINYTISTTWNNMVYCNSHITMA